MNGSWSKKIVDDRMDNIYPGIINFKGIVPIVLNG